MNIRTITSAQNPTLKFVRSLDMKKYRDEHKSFVVEGLRHVLEGLTCGWTLKMLFCLENEKGGAPFQQALHEAQKQRTEIYSLPADVMQKLTHRDNAQSVVGVFEQRSLRLEDVSCDSVTPVKTGVQLNESKENWTPDQVRGDDRGIDPSCNESRLKIIPHSPWVALEGIKDPGNLGTIIRTLDSVGPRGGVILIGNTCDPYSLECVRASMGSLFNIPIVKVPEKDFFAWAKNFTGRIVGTHLKATVDYRAVPNPDASTVLLMGNEQSGLPDSYLPLCTSVVKIPMRGRADSLNLSIATGIMLYKLVKD